MIVGTILDKIIREKKKEVVALKKKCSGEPFNAKTFPKRPAYSFYKALKMKRRPAVIAEIKRKSPSRGILRRKFDALSIARQYKENGAVALSVLTDKIFFGGEISTFQKVRQCTHLPLLRKDFVIDASQVRQSRAMGADAILLIASILSTKKMRELSGLASSLGMDSLFEIHNEKELKKILPLNPKIVGINNRNLKNFDVDLDTTENLLKKYKVFFKKRLVVSESGIKTQHDMRYLKKLGVDAVLVGETLMAAKNPGLALRELMHGSC